MNLSLSLASCFALLFVFGFAAIYFRFRNGNDLLSEVAEAIGFSFDTFHLIISIIANFRFQSSPRRYGGRRFKFLINLIDFYLTPINILVSIFKIKQVIIEIHCRSFDLCLKIPHIENPDAAKKIVRAIQRIVFMQYSS